MDESKTAAVAAAPASPQPAPPPLRPGAPRETPAPAAAPPPCASDALVEQWWNDHFPGSAVARVTAAWNAAFTAKEDLKRRLKKGL